MSATVTAVGGEYARGHCCACAESCFHTGPAVWCDRHRPASPLRVVVTTSSGTPHGGCGAHCACYWRGRRDEAKA